MAGNNFLNLPSKNDFQKFLDGLDGHIDLKLGSFVVPIVMYCVSFPYILTNNASEYIAWILIFFLNVTFPFAYINELFMLSRKTLKGGAISGYIIAYSILSIVVAYALQFIVLLFVVLKNENIRKGKEKKGDYENEGKQNIDTQDWIVEYRDKNIGILFISGAALIWAMVINHFASDLQLNLFNPDKLNANSVKETPQVQMDEKFPIGSRIHWFVDLFSKMLKSMDESWHEIVDNIPLGPLAKSSLVYCISFITIIFSVFIRFKYVRKNLKTLGPDGFHEESVRIVKRKGHTIENVGSLFGKTFQTNVRLIRILAIVSIVFFVIIFGGMLGYLFKFLLSLMKYDIGSSFPDWFRFEHGLVGWAVVCSAVLFPAFFAEKTHQKNKIKDKIFPLHESVYFKRDDNINYSKFDEKIVVYYSGDEIVVGELKLNQNGNDKNIKQVIAEIGYYFKQYLFTADKINNIGELAEGNTDGGSNHVIVNGHIVDVGESFKLLVKKFQNVNGFDVSVPKSKEKDYERFKPEFKSIMEQIYMQNYGVFASDRTEYGDANPGMEHPFVYEESAEYKEKKKIYETDRGNMPLKTYIFFLICLWFSFYGSMVITAATSLIGGIYEKYFYAIYSVVFIITTFIMFGIGMGGKFLEPEKAKKLKTFLAVLFTMIGASFFAFSTRFNMLTFL